MLLVTVYLVFYVIDASLLPLICLFSAPLAYVLWFSVSVVVTNLLQKVRLKLTDAFVISETVQ